MSLVEANRRFTLELLRMLNRKVMIITKSGAVFTGQLVGVDSSLNMIIADAEDDKHTRYPRVLITGQSIDRLALLEERLDLRDFAKYAEKYFPGMVKYVEEANVVLIGNKVRVSEAGVEGEGPVARRVKEILDEYLSKRK